MRERKCLYLIGGPMGVGKTAACRALQKRLDRAVFLDGDWCWDMRPFQVTEETKRMVLENICFLLNNFLRCSAFDHVIFLAGCFTSGKYCRRCAPAWTLQDGGFARCRWCARRRPSAPGWRGMSVRDFGRRILWSGALAICPSTGNYPHGSWTSPCSRRRRRPPKSPGMRQNAGKDNRRWETNNACTCASCP